MGTTARPVEVFCSYAHQDEAFVRGLKTHLSTLLRQQVISLWYDRQVLPGTDWAREIDERLNRASLILLLISSDFLASDYCYGVEMARALKRQTAHEARVVPVLVRAVDWQDEPIASLLALPTGARPIASWQDRDEAFADVARGLRKVIAELTVLSADVAPANPLSAWNVPFPRNPFFTGREDQLARLSAQLHNEQGAAIGQAISGLGGIGKTQLAVEYAYRYRGDYQVVLWATAESVETLNASYVELAAHLRLPEKDAQEQEAIVRAVKDWLRTQHTWLLILDNADRPELLAPFLPPLVGGHLLVTTRAAALGDLDLGIGQPLPLDTFTREQGANFLLRRAGLFAQAGEHEHTLAYQIAEDLGDLPLALDQAGAYLEATGTSLDAYMLIYQQRRNDLLARRRGRSHPDPVATTWSLSIQRVEQSNAAAAELLRFCAFLAPDAIPEELFSAGARQLGPILAAVAADCYRLNEAIAALRAYSLINRDPQERTLSVHRLVQFVLRQEMDSSKRAQWERRAVLALHAAFSRDEFEDWPLCERLLPHVLLYATWRGQAQHASLAAASLASRAGSYLLTRARYREAEQLLLHALATRELLLGALHPDVAESLKRLGMLRVKQGKYEEAELLLRRALALTQNIHGPDHPTVAPGLDSLAMLYSEQGRYAQAEEFHRRALAICAQTLGPDDPTTVGYLNNLATCYAKQNLLEKAEPLFLRTMAITEQHLGSEHPNVGKILINLASVYSGQEKYAEAEPLLRRALVIAEQHLGTEHPDVADGLINLAHIYAMQGKSAQAREFYQRALALYERVLGVEHPRTQSARQRYVRLQQAAENGERTSEKHVLE